MAGMQVSIANLACRESTFADLPGCSSGLTGGHDSGADVRRAPGAGRFPPYEMDDAGKTRGEETGRRLSADVIRLFSAEPLPFRETRLMLPVAGDPPAWNQARGSSLGHAVLAIIATSFETFRCRPF
jgi:hypothetical protein